MARRNFGSSQFASTDAYSDTEDADPRVGLVNLADVMLVFACGLMIALVSHWGVSLSTVEGATAEDMDQIDNVEDMIEKMQSGGGAYNERGTVYEDPETGTMYLLEEKSGDSDSASSDSQSDSE